MRGTPLFGRRVYVRQGPVPRCPEHQIELSDTARGSWYCGWTKTEKREGRHGFYEHVTRCTYKPGRHRYEVEPWTDDDNAYDTRSEGFGVDRESE